MLQTCSTCLKRVKIHFCDFCCFLPALLVASAFRAVARMKGGSCVKPGWALAALFIPAALLMLSLRGALSSQKMSQAAMSPATVAAAGPGHSLTDDLPGLQALVDFTSSERAHVWLLSLVGSVAVGLSGIFPLLVIPVEAGAALKSEGKTPHTQEPSVSNHFQLLGFPLLWCAF